MANLLYTNFSKGELSPLIEGRPDLAAYFEGLRVGVNFNILRQGGLDRRPGFRYICETRYSNRDTILIPFEATTEVGVYVLELGDRYMRFLKNGAQIMSGGVPYQIDTPWTADQIREVHFTQSVDVMFLNHPSVAQQKLIRVSDTLWTINDVRYDPPPTFEADTDISGGVATLTLTALTGTGVVVNLSSAVLLRADAGRQLVIGAGRGTISQYVNATQFKLDIIDDFTELGPIPAGQWLLRLGPQTSISVAATKPKGLQIGMVAGTTAFRPVADLGKYISVYGGLVKITAINSNGQNINARIIVEMSGTSSEKPPAAPAGAWTLEVPAWSTVFGFPRTNEFYQGRLGQASTFQQRVNWWLSASDNFEDYGVGISADRALDYPVASRQLNRIVWMADAVDLFLGTDGAIIRIRSPKDSVLGGDTIPLPEKVDDNGCAPIQPTPIGRRLIYIDRSLRKVFVMVFNVEEDGFDAAELTDASEHITEPSIRLGPAARAKRPDPRVYWIRSDGQMVTLTYFHLQKVIGFTRYTTEGTFEATCIVPRSSGQNDQQYVITRRTIGGVQKQFIEVAENNYAAMAARAWQSLQTDCCVALAGAMSTVPAPHLEGKTVDVLVDGAYVGQKVVANGIVTLDDASTTDVEVGLHYDSDGQTMRPAVQGQVTEGLPRTWIKIFMRVYKTMGGKIGTQEIDYEPANLGTLPLKTGDVDVTSYDGIDTEGRISFKQHLPYPMTVLGLFGEIEFGAHM